MTTPQTPDLSAIKGRQQKAWSSGDYGKVGVTLSLWPSSWPRPQTSSPARGCSTWPEATATPPWPQPAASARCTAIDYVPMLLEGGTQEGRSRGPLGGFQGGRRGGLPFEDASFDVVLSTLGVMFAPDQEKAAGELMRVGKPGGTIAMANWVPDSYVGELFKTIGKYVPPPPGLNPPFRWGTEEGLDELLDGGIGSLQTRRRSLVWRFPLCGHHVEFMRGYYGPLNKAFGALDEEGQKALEQDLISLAERYDRSEDGTVLLHADYLEVVATRR